MPNKKDNTYSCGFAPRWGKARMVNTRNVRNNTKKSANGAGEPEYSSPFLATSASTVLPNPKSPLSFNFTTTHTNYFCLFMVDNIHGNPHIASIKSAIRKRAGD